jgi:aromatic ring-cleaving dioxygenase
VHIYYFQSNPEQTKFAQELWQRVRLECEFSRVSWLISLVPELRIYKLWDRPIGPHPLAMFEVNLFTPAQFGAFIPWLIINRGPLSALVHPNTTDEEEERDHTQRATWLGQPVPLDLSIFKIRARK